MTTDHGAFSMRIRSIFLAVADLERYTREQALLGLEEW